MGMGFHIVVSPDALAAPSESVSSCDDHRLTAGSGSDGGGGGDGGGDGSGSGGTIATVGTWFAFVLLSFVW